MTQTAFSEKDHADCAAAEKLVDEAARISDEGTYDALMDRAYQLLAPLVARQLPAAQYLCACYSLSRECEREEDAYTDSNYGYPKDETRAQYYRQRMLDTDVIDY